MGRALYLIEKGKKAKLIKYCSSDFTPENFILACF